MISRLFQIVYLLMEQPHITAEQLAKRLEVSTRTIYRDLDKLSAAGIPVYTNRGRSGGISLLSDFVLDKTVLTNEERNKILESLQALAAVGSGEEEKALEKLQDFFGTESQDWIEVDFSNWREDDKQRDCFEQCKWAILHHHLMEIEYVGMNTQTSKRHIRPLKLCFRGQAWYLYAFCEMRADYRYFKLRRILSLEVLAECFPAEKVKRLMGRNIENNTKGKRMVVRLQIDREMAFRAYEEFTILKSDKAGNLICEMDAWGMGELIEYLLSYGKYAEIIEPIEIRNQMKEVLQKMNEKYDN